MDFLTADKNDAAAILAYLQSTDTVDVTFSAVFDSQNFHFTAASIEAEKAMRKLGLFEQAPSLNEVIAAIQDLLGMRDKFIADGYMVKFRAVSFSEALSEDTPEQFF